MPQSTEVRLHGLGDHSEFSSLGSAQEPVNLGEPVRPPRELPFCLTWLLSWFRDLPPVHRSRLPQRPHDVVLLNWSRYTRRKLGFIWFFGLPFSFVNMAGYMTTAAPATSSLEHRMARLRRGVSLSVPHVFGLLLTACALVWTAAAFEVFLRHWKAPSFVSLERWGQSPLWLSAFLLVLPIVWRLWRRKLHANRGEALRKVVAVPHLLVIALVLYFVEVGNWVRSVQTPSFWRLSITDSWPSVSVDLWPWISACTPPGTVVLTPDTLSPWRCYPELSVDSLALVVGVAFVALVCFTLVAFVLILLPGIGQDRIALGGALAAGWAGFAVQSSVFGLVVLGLDWLPIYMQARFIPFGDLKSTAMDCAGPAWDQGMSACFRHVIPFEPTAVSPWYHLTFIPAAMFAVCLAVLLVARYGGNKSEDGARGCRAWRLRRCHAAVRRLGTAPGWQLAVIVAIAGAIPWYVWLTIVDRDPTVWDSAYGAIAHGGALAGVLRLLTAGRAPRLTSLDYVADLVGFWPIRFHPLSGASYRHAVVRGLNKALDDLGSEGKRVVLVGHSQGSVLAAWVTHERGEEADRSDEAKHGDAAEYGDEAKHGDDEEHGEKGKHALITCGSPLGALYAPFFPEHFPPKWFDKVRSHSGWWVNTWRDTDPISAPIAALKKDCNRQLKDTERPVKGHSNYWEDKEQGDIVEAALEYVPSERPAR